jgi:2-polyprenyl-3-methyl-5-hydroxy-6-metoxy-1,4-benzoquinol methylase
MPPLKAQAPVPPEESSMTTLMEDEFPEVRENVFGLNRRLNFIYQCLRDTGKVDLSILDVGCGTGEFLTVPLAGKGLRVLGMDVHQASLDRGTALAAERGIPTVRFTRATLDELGEQFDAVILSEVIEHVRPAAPLLKAIRRRLKPGGHLLLTLPNGYGPFEFDQLFWKRNFLFLPKIYERWKRLSLEAASGQGVATLNEDSPHVNWFSLSAIRRLLRDHGFEIRRFQSRTFLSGNYLGLWVGALQRVGLPMEWFARANARVADILPGAMTSGWMFFCQMEPDDAIQELS